MPLTSHSSPLLPNLRLWRHTAAHFCPTYASNVTQQPTPAQPTPLTSHSSPLLPNLHLSLSHSSPLLPNLHLSRHTAAHSCPTYTSDVTQQPTPAQPTPLTSHNSPLLPNLHLRRHTSAQSCQTPHCITSTTVVLPQKHQGMEQSPSKRCSSGDSWRLLSNLLFLTLIVHIFTIIFLLYCHLLLSALHPGSNVQPVARGLNLVEAEEMWRNRLSSSAI